MLPESPGFPRPQEHSGGAAAWAGAFRSRTQHFLSSRPLHRKESISLRMELNVLADCPLLTLPGPPTQRNQLGP